MRRASILVLVVGLVLLAMPALAGGAECQKKAAQAAQAGQSCTCCDMSAEKCKKWMAEAKSRPWLGIETHLDKETGAWTVVRVVPDSPAERAGFRAGDQLVALNGVAFGDANKEQLASIKKSLKFGDAVSYTVRRDGSEQKLAATLAKMPESVYLAMVEHHAKEHTEVASR
jgi:S1-C subfamily serine protease